MTASEAEIRSAVPGRGSPTSVAWLSLVAIGLVGVVLPLAIARHYGALGAARGDDWSYLVTLFRWVDTGRLEFNNWVSMSLIGQLVLAAPVAVARGHAITLVQAETTLIGFGGLAALALLGRRLGIPWGVATFGAVTFAVSPLWLILSTTFMTDVPAFTVSTVGLLLVTIALQRRPVSLPLLIMGFAVALYAVLIRQYAIVPVLAIVIAAGLSLLAERDRRRGMIFALAVAIGVVAVLVFLAWWSTVPDAKAISPSLPSMRDARTSVIKGAGFLRLAGLLLVPAICWRGPVRVARAAWESSRVVTAFAVGGTAMWQAVTANRYLSSQFVGNYVIRDGALSIAVLPGRRPDQMPPTVWNGLVLVGSIGALILMAAVVPTVMALIRRLRDHDLLAADPITSLLGLTVFGFGCAYGIAMIAGVQVYDRYALPAIAVVILLLLRGSPTDHEPRRVIVAGVALALLLVVGLNAAVDSASFDGGRWRLAQQVVEEYGWRPKRVNGGFEWVNFHRGRRGTVAARARVIRVLPDGTVVRIAPYCVNLRVLSGNARPTRPPIASVRYVALLRGSVRIVALRSPRPCIAPAGSLPRDVSGGSRPTP